jgi:hypothetical protein
MPRRREPTAAETFEHSKAIGKAIFGGLSPLDEDRIDGNCRLLLGDRNFCSEKDAGILHRM